jgi:hypothetical protein
MYEYLWMQRPILALVHQNPQMANLLRSERHKVLETGGWGNAQFQGVDEAGRPAMSEALEQFTLEWSAKRLLDNGKAGIYTTEACVKQLCSLVRV